VKECNFGCDGGGNVIIKLRVFWNVMMKQGERNVMMKVRV